MIVRKPGASLPQQSGGWADAKGAYRLFSNAAVDPRAMAGPHCGLTRRRCRGRGVVLAVQDDTDLTGRSKALREADHVQHTTLAVLPDGPVLGVLDVAFFLRVRTPPQGETRLQRESRWRETCVWSDAVAAVGRPPEGCRMIHVADRASDDLNFMDAALAQGCGFLIRAKHDRRLVGGGKLWDHLAARQPVGRVEAEVGTQRDGHGAVTRVGRVATLAVRSAPVVLLPPYNHPGEHQPLKAWAVYLKEEHPPAKVEAAAAAVEWMLLCSEPVEDFGDAVRVAGWYQQRWTIEEFHRVLKEGLGVERSQLDETADQERLSSVLSVIAVRMLQLRDLADDRETADDPKALALTMPSPWIEIVANLAGVERGKLTPRLFHLTIARRGGYLARRCDPRPGWKVMWRGWLEVSLMVEGAARMLTTPGRGP
jgi:hypothetical protein